MIAPEPYSTVDCFDFRKPLMSKLSICRPNLIANTIAVWPGEAA